VISHRLSLKVKQSRLLSQSFGLGGRRTFVLACRSAYATEVSGTATRQLTLFPCAFEPAIAFAPCPIARSLELGSLANTPNGEFSRYHAVAILVEMIVAARSFCTHFCAGQCCETGDRDRSKKELFHNGLPRLTQPFCWVRASWSHGWWDRFKCAVPELFLKRQTRQHGTADRRMEDNDAEPSPR
jgi:hypothetical protein